MIDLHVHTIYSDGEYTPKEILEMCKKRNITVVGITDHNTMPSAVQMYMRRAFVIIRE